MLALQFEVLQHELGANPNSHQGASLRSPLLSKPLATPWVHTGNGTGTASALASASAKSMQLFFKKWYDFAFHELSISVSKSQILSAFKEERPREIVSRYT
jgi:hypothetical protein